MTLPKYLYDPDNYVEVLGNFNKIGSAAVTAASRIYLSEGGGALLPTTIPGLVIAHNCYWLPLFHAWLVDDITKPATILISGFNGAQSTLWIDPSTAFFGIWNDSMWQVYPPTGAQLLSMPGAGSFRTSGNYDWSLVRFIVKEIPLHDVIYGDPAIGRIAPYPSAPFNGRPLAGDIGVNDNYGWWKFTIPQGSALVAAEVLLEYYLIAPAAGVTVVTVNTRGNTAFGTDRDWTYALPIVGTEESTLPGSNVATNMIQVVSVPLVFFFIDNTQNEYYVRIKHNQIPGPTSIPMISGIRISYLEAGIRTPM